MTATASAPTVGSVPRQRAGFDRWALAVITPIGPLAIAIVRGILPYKTSDSNTTVATLVAAHQGTENLVIWLTFIAMLTLIPGVITVGLLARRGAPRLGTVGLVVSFAAFMSLFWSPVAGGDNVALAAARIGVDPALTGRLLDSMNAVPALGLGANLFVAGHILGLLLIGIALWRGRVLPSWAALMIALSQVLHFVFAVIVPVQALDGAAWGLAVVGFAVAARTLVREPGLIGAQVAA